MKIEKILIYSRRRNHKRLQLFVTQLFIDKKVNIDIWSDENLYYNDVKKFNKFLYKNLNNNFSLPFEIDMDIKNEMILRCRYLRTLNNDLALSLLNSALYSWYVILDKYKYEFIFSLPIDSYINDSLYFISKKMNIPFLTAISSLYKNRVRFTQRGEIIGKIDEKFIDLDKIKELEVNLKSNNFKPDFLYKINKVTLYKRYLIDLLKKPMFYLYRNILKDPYSFSFAAWKFYKYRSIASFNRLKTILRIEKNSLIKLPKKYIYIPLQFYPEATTDYWIPEIDMINFHNNVLQIVKFLKKYNIDVIIKEHPASLGRRDENFLLKLYSMSNVKFISTYYPNSDIISNAFLVIGYGSTSMLEAMIKGKSVLFMGTPYYGNCSCEKLSTLSEKEFDEKYQKAINFKVDDNCIKNILNNIFIHSGEGSQGEFDIIGEHTNLSSEPIITDSLIEHFFSSLQDIL